MDTKTWALKQKVVRWERMKRMEEELAELKGKAEK